MDTTSKLQAVNTLLTSIGEDPVNTLDTGLDDQIVAENILDETSRKVQIRGWSWNTEHDTKLLRQLDNTITLSNNFFSIDFHNKRYALRGNKVYDRVNHTYLLSEDITCSSIILGLDWLELPEVARQYITYIAGRIFQARQVGSRILWEFTKQDEQEAWVELVANEEAVGNRTIFQNNQLQMDLNRSSHVSVYDHPPGTIFGSS